MVNLLPSRLIRGHIKALRAGGHRPWGGKVMVAFVYLTPLAVFVLSLVTGFVLRAPAALLTAAALISGGALSAFTHLSNLRQRLTDRADSYAKSEAPERKLVDISATHLLMCALGAMTSAVSLVVGMTLFGSFDPASKAYMVDFGGVIAGISVGLLTWTALLFWIAIPKLYAAYVQIHDVQAELNGADRL